MNLWQRYRKLTIWNRLGAWGNFASIMSIPLTLMLFAVSTLVSIRLANRPPTPTREMAAKTAEEDLPVKKTAPTVTFSDGQRASVGFTVTTSVAEKDTVLMVLKCGSSDKAMASLDGVVLSTVIAEMEKRTLAEVRQTRTQIGKELRSTLSPSFKDVGLTLDDISLTEIAELSSGPKL